jgi:hypothetical protein
MRLSGAPWANQGAAAYEDWYLVRDMADLAPLNEGAVSGPRKEPHDAAARLAAGGAAGLYRLLLGASRELPAAAAWFGKPAGMTHAALSALLEPIVAGAEGTLWMRQMVLGPTPEFCLRSPGPLALPPALVALHLSLSPVWPAA